MAQRTGAERFLASPAKTASAGGSLALAVAVLLLPGCGGGSADPENSTTADTAGAAGAQSGASSPTGSREASKTGAAKAKAGGKGGSSGGESPAGGSGQKHGPPIAAPPKGGREQAPTPAESANATVADIALESPAIPTSAGSAGSLPSTYTCDGKDIWPALRWSGVPAGSAELILYAMNAQPVAGRLFIDWALAGLDPGLGGIEAGRLPKGAVVATNSFGKLGYSICPPAGSGETYIFALFALPRALSPQKGFDPRVLREEILAISGDVGLLPAVYARG